MGGDSDCVDSRIGADGDRGKGLRTGLDGEDAEGVWVMGVMIVRVRSWLYLYYRHTRADMGSVRCCYDVVVGLLGTLNG